MTQISRNCSKLKFFFSKKLISLIVRRRTKRGSTVCIQNYVPTIDLSFSCPEDKDGDRYWLLLFAKLFLLSETTQYFFISTIQSYVPTIDPSFSCPDDKDGAGMFAEIFLFSKFLLLAYRDLLSS